MLQYIAVSTAVPAYCQLGCKQVSTETRNKGVAYFQWAPKDHQMMEILSRYELLPGNVEKLVDKAVLEMCCAEIGLTSFQNNDSYLKS